LSETNLQPGRRNKSKFTNVGRVLDDVVRGLGLDKRIKEQALRQIWPTLIGEPFQGKTRVLFIDSEGNLVVSARDGSTAQELTFAKRELLAKMRPPAKALGLNLKGLRLDLKHYFDKIEPDTEGSLINRSLTNVQIETPDEAELNRIELSELDKRKIDDLSVALKSADQSAACLVPNEQNEDRLERILKIYERQLRLVNWRHSKGFPSCSKCNYPTTKLHTINRLCSECYLQEKATKA
jgi:hypothetical protein